MMTSPGKFKLISLTAFFVSVFACGQASALDTSVTVRCSNERGKVNRMLFGNNLLGYESYTCADYGAGIWDPKLKMPVSETINLAKEAGISMVRFPGGCGTHLYDWKKAIGAERDSFLYGLDEFLKTCMEIGAEAVITVSYFTGNEFDAADLVKYLKPHGVKYFEVGNEVWHGDHKKTKKVLPEEYAVRYLKYYGAMKNADSDIRIGAVLYTDDWNKKVLDIIKDKLDFGIMHFYPSESMNKGLIEHLGARSLFKGALGRSVEKTENDLHMVLKVLKEKAARDIPLAITEYNIGFFQEKPVPYRHSLGAALLNAELLRIFMKPENNILMANYWDFVNEYWGMAANGFDGEYEDLYKPYYKRPNYYVYELYNKHFGDILVDAKADKASYLSVNASKGKDGKKLYLVVINKNMDFIVTANIKLKDFDPSEEADTWILNGPEIDSTNEEDRNNVGVKHLRFKLIRTAEGGDAFTLEFEPHSLTALELTGKVY